MCYCTIIIIMNILTVTILTAENEYYWDASWLKKILVRQNPDSSDWVSVCHLSETNRPLSAVTVCCLSVVRLLRESNISLHPSLTPALSLSPSLSVTAAGWWWSQLSGSCHVFDSVYTFPWQQASHICIPTPPPTCKHSIHSLLLCFHSELGSTILPLNFICAAGVCIFYWVLFCVFNILQCGWNHCFFTDAAAIFAKTNVWQLELKLQMNTPSEKLCFYTTTL